MISKHTICNVRYSAPAVANLCSLLPVNPSTTVRTDTVICLPSATMPGPCRGWTAVVAVGSLTGWHVPLTTCRRRARAVGLPTVGRTMKIPSQESAGSDLSRSSFLRPKLSNQRIWHCWPSGSVDASWRRWNFPPQLMTCWLACLVCACVW